MLQPYGFALGKCLSASGRSLVHAAVRLEDRREVVLKTASAASPSSGSAAAREMAALQAVRGEGVVEALALLSDESPPVLVLERVKGVSLAAWVRSSPPGVEDFLEVAIGLAAGLERVHAARWLHCDVSPQNVMVEPGRLRTCWIDFALARPLGGSSRAGGALGSIHDLRYIAPEQTGRMNRGIDARSDLYSLGCVLYFALVGKPPFDLSDPLALIHAQMARRPPPPAELRPELPAALSRAVMKLLEKEPDDRYQSARALVADLRACQAQMRESGTIDADLALGLAEAPDRPRFSSKLYDRDHEIALLRELYDQARQGSAQLLMLAGEPGSGKSALVDELRPQIAQSGGYLAVGKFDLASDRPCGAWTDALGSFVQQMLTESDARLARVREELREGLGNVARAMIDLVPDLEFVIGEVPPLPKLPPRETQARQALALRRFIVACATREHPLLVFLDDLQWSDAASRELLEDITAHERKAHLFIVGAYRGNEVGPDHPLTRSFENLSRRDVPVRTVSLRSLSPEATVAMLADVLDRTPEQVRGLAELIERKTGNAPLFVRQFVGHLHGQGLLRYAAGSGWTWDPEEVAAAAIPDGAVELIAAKLHGLRPEARAAIELASCLGDTFDLGYLCELSSLERESLEEGIYTLCDQGLISTFRDGFRFVHDRVREAARDLLSPEQQERLHFEIAHLLLERIPADEQPSRIFEICEHLNRGIAHLPETQRVTAIRINCDAGKIALACGAAPTAASLFAVAQGLLRETDWSADPALAFDLCMASIESDVLLGRLEAALAGTHALDRRELSQIQAAQVAGKRVQILTRTSSPEEAARYAREQLLRFGVRLPLRTSELRASLTVRWLRWRLRGERAQRTLRFCTTLDPSWIAPIVLVGASAPVLARASYRLLVLATCWAARSNLRHGALGGPSYTLGGIACFVQDLLGDTPEAERLERLCLAHLERVPDAIYGPRTELTLHSTLRPWRMARRTALAPLPALAEALDEIGDVEHSSYTRFIHLLLRALAGDPVHATGERFHELCATVRHGGHLYPDPELCARPYAMLTAPDASSGVLAAEIEASEREVAAYPGSVESYVRTLWLMVLCVHGRFDLALEQADRMGDRLIQTIRFVHVADHTFYRGLAAAARSPVGERPTRRERRIVRQSLRKLRRWARFGADFRHMTTLLEAERARLAGKGRRARALYERAATQARQQEFPHHAALAHERLASLLSELRHDTEASAARAQAHALYKQWGAGAKCAALRAAHAGLGTV